MRGVVEGIAGGGVHDGGEAPKVGDVVGRILEFLHYGILKGEDNRLIYYHEII